MRQEPSSELTSRKRRKEGWQESTKKGRGKLYAKGAKVDWLARTRADMASAPLSNNKPLPARRHSLDIVTGRRSSRSSFSMKRTNEW